MSQSVLTMSLLISAGRSLFYQAVKEVFPLDAVVKTNCFGCSVNHPSQDQHDLCLMSGVGMQIFRCYKEALVRIPGRKLMETLVEVVDKSEMKFVDAFDFLFSESDPLEKLKHDGEMQLEFVCFLLEKDIPYDVRSSEGKIYSICSEHDQIN